MLRARRLAATCRHHRYYTPIWQPNPSADHVTPLRDADERRTLWAPRVPIPSVGAAVEAWIRYGNDPVLHTALPVVHGGRTVTAPVGNTQASPFAYVEDYMGTNMVFGSQEHVRESAAFWASYYERRYACLIRQSRRTVANHIGVVNAPEVFTDESDRPDTKWSQDTYFRECSYMSEKYLKEKVTNLEQFERALRRASPEAYLAFFDAFQQQTQTQIPLPSPSVWHYEGERRKQWAERFIPVSHESHRFFQEILAVDIKKLQGAQDKVLQKIAVVFGEVGKVLVRRHQRRLGGRQWGQLNETEKQSFCESVVRLWGRQVVEGEFDLSEFDGDEENDEWKAEHTAIMELLSTHIEGLSFTALDFWLHAIRCEELETEHIHTEERIRKISAAAMKEIYDTTSIEAVIQGIVESIARGQLDMSALCFKPFASEVWCKMHYAKFGASTITQHTTTSSRQLLFFHASSVKEVAASASLYYATRPLSNALDYSSPYKYRRSLVSLCSTYGIDMSYAAQRPLLLSAAHLARAEDLIRTVVAASARPFGERRRAALTRRRTERKTLLPPAERITVHEVGDELRARGAAPVATSPETKIWPLGARRAVSYHLPRGVQVAETSSEHNSVVVTAVLEVSLWRRLGPEEAQRKKEAQRKAEQNIVEITRAVPQLAQVQEYAVSLFQRLTAKSEAAEVEEGIVGGEWKRKEEKEKESTETENVNRVGKESAEEGEWEFAVMLDDRAAINAEETLDLYLPYTDANGVPLPPGEYRVRVRRVDKEQRSPSYDSVLSADGFSTSLEVFDAIPQLVAQFFRTEKPGADPAATIPHIPGAEFISFCTFLRKAGLDVPMRCEFEAGQTLTTDGDVYMDHFLHLLRGDAFHQSYAQSGLTEVQLRMEPSCRAHWEVHHPGANAAEWAEARRAVLDAAMEHEREWWFPNEMLDVQDVATGSVNGLSFTMCPPTTRYGVELCTVLTADGHATRDGLSALSTVDGTGAATSLVLESTRSTDTMDIDEALSLARLSLQRAQDRHSTLSAFRLGSLAKQAQVLVFCSVHGLEFGGKYARTYAYAFEKAKKELAEAALSGRVVPGLADDAVERESEKESADRFASTTHPEQRKTRFVPRLGPGATPMEDPSPDQKSLWGR